MFTMMVAWILLAKEVTAENQNQDTSCAPRCVHVAAMEPDTIPLGNTCTSELTEEMQECVNCHNE